VIAGWCFGTGMLVLIFLFITATVILPLKGVDVGVSDFWMYAYKTFIWDTAATARGEGMGLLTLSIVLYLLLMGVVWFFFLDKKVPFAIRNRQYWDIFVRCLLVFWQIRG
jgi:hypothetical protein